MSAPLPTQHISQLSHAGNKRPRAHALPIAFFGDVTERARKRLQHDCPSSSSMAVSSVGLSSTSTSLDDSDAHQPSTSAGAIVMDDTLKCEQRKVLYITRIVLPRRAIAEHLSHARQQWAQDVCMQHSDGHKWNVSISLRGCNCEDQEHPSAIERMNCRFRNEPPDDRWLTVTLKQSIRATDTIFVSGEPLCMKQMQEREADHHKDKHYDFMDDFPPDEWNSVDAQWVIWIGIGIPPQSTEHDTKTASAVQGQGPGIFSIWKAVKMANQGDLTFRTADGEEIHVPSMWILPVCPLLRIMHKYQPAATQPIVTAAAASSTSAPSKPMSEPSNAALVQLRSTIVHDGRFDEPYVTPKQLWAMIDALVLDELPQTSEWTCAEWEPFYEMCHRWLVDVNMEHESAASSSSTAVKDTVHLPIMHRITQAFSAALCHHVRSHDEACVVRRIATTYPALSSLVQQLDMIERTAYDALRVLNQ